METGATMLDLVGNGITTILGWFGTVIDSLLNADGELNPLASLLAIGISISAILLSVRIIKTFVWGA